MANEYNFNDPISTKIQRAVKQTALKLGKSTIFAIRDQVNNDFTVEFDFSENDGYYDNEGTYLSGTERLVNLSFVESPYLNSSGNTILTPEIDLEICTIEISGSNRIVKTNITNQIGSVKEITGRDDYSLSISGVLVGNFGIPTKTDIQNGKPIEQMRKIIKICEAGIPVQVVSDYLNNFGITHIVIENYSFPQDLESSNLQRFTLSASSDDDDLALL